MNIIQEMLSRRQQAFVGRRYVVEPHGPGFAIYAGRDAYHHGANLGQLTECDRGLPKQIENALNLRINLESAESSPEFDRQLRQCFVERFGNRDQGVALASVGPWDTETEARYANFKAGASLMVDFYAATNTTGAQHE